MSRPLQRLAFVGVALAMAAAGAARGQPPAPAPDQPLEGDTLDSLREIAKAKFEAMHRTAAERAKARVETVRVGYTHALKAYMSGTTTLDWLLAWSDPVLEARRAAEAKDADPTPFFEDAWAQAVVAENVSEAKLAAGKITTEDLAQVQWIRLRAEAAWLRSRAEHVHSPPPEATGFEIRLEGLEPSDPLRELDEQRKWAKEKVKALETAPGERTASEVKAAEECYRGRWNEYLTGKTTLDLLQEAQQRLLATELAALGKDADPTPLLRLNVELAREVEAITADKLATGKVTNPDFLSCRCIRLDAEAALVRALAHRPKPDGPNPAVPERLRGDPHPFDPYSFDSATQAKAAFETVHADVNELNREKLEDARQVFREERQWYAEGKTTLDLTIKASLRWLDAERAVHSGKEEQEAALERHWRRMLALEQMTESKLAAGKVTVADLMAVRYARQLAEAWWLDGDGK
jgi:hypothetical protein